MGTPRLESDPMRYIRRVKGDKYQARPWLDGRRYNLGLFATPGAARKAIDDFHWGRLGDGRPKYVRPIRRRFGGLEYLAAVHVAPGRVVKVGRFDTEAEASDAVRKFLAANYEPEKAERMLSGAG